MANALLKPAPPASRDEIADMLVEVEALRAAIVREATSLLAAWGVAPAERRESSKAQNLAHYIALRGNDLVDLQYRLAAHGLSSLGRSEARVLPALDALIATLRRLAGGLATPYPSPATMRAGQRELEAATCRIFGEPGSDAPRTRIMATLPSEAADDAGFVARLVAAGADCVRINCAHDDEAAWERMIVHVRAAGTRLGKPCKVLMDIAGPKCRVERVQGDDKIRLRSGDRVQLVTDLADADRDAPAFTISFPEIIAELALGAEVHIDDGKAAARVVEVDPNRVELEVYAAREKGVRLKPAKGVNFPATELSLPPLTRKDFADLDFIATHADCVGYSFVQRSDDVQLLQDHLAVRAHGRERHPLVLKIETPLAVRNLPRLILQSAAHNPTAVMIARGDLAVELGFARLSEMQEEILWLCEAAHTPVVWATQVLDGYVREGIASRAEMTDAAMAQGAECVMLNKGARLVEGIAFLKDVLARMDRHHAKKFARYTALGAWR